jgi:hypothetical protein
MNSNAVPIVAPSSDSFGQPIQFKAIFFATRMGASAVQETVLVRMRPNTSKPYLDFLELNECLAGWIKQFKEPIITKGWRKPIPGQPMHEKLGCA